MDFRAAKTATFLFAFFLATLVGVLVPSTAEAAWYPNGTLLQGSGPGVYQIVNGRSYGVPNVETLNSCMGGWTYVGRVSDYELSQAILTNPYNGLASCPISMPERTVFRSVSRPEVYVMLNGKYSWVPNSATLSGCYGGWGAVRVIPDYQFGWVQSRYVAGPTATCPYTVSNGTKLLAPTGTVFIILDGRSYGMPSADVLNTCYGGWANVRSVSNDEITRMLNTYPYAGAASCSVSSSREIRAVEWVRTQIGTTAYNGWCEKFVENAFGTTGRYPSALAHANARISRGEMHSGDRNVPAGAIAFFGASSVNGNYGHVMVSIGSDQFVSSGYTYAGKTYGAFVTAINESYFGPYIGWAWADTSWPGR